MKKENPIIQDVIDRYQLIKMHTEMFVSNNNSAMRGLLISGDAGFGKTHFTRLGLSKANPDQVDYIKGSSISAAALYVKLYQSRHEGSVLILDDVDIINKNKSEFLTMLDLIKGATETDKDLEKRVIAWERANNNPLMRQNEVPSSFVFNGSIIWITNETIEGIANAAMNHWGALDSRFNLAQAWLNDQEKLLYTLYLVEEVDMLGKECYAKDGGYTKDTIEKVVYYLRKNYKYMYDFNDKSTISPRSAIKLADNITNFGDQWEKYCNIQFIGLK